MHTESRRRPRTASPRLEGLETLVLLNGDPVIAPEVAPAPEVESTPAPDQPTDPGTVSTETQEVPGGDGNPTVFTAEDQASTPPEIAATSAPTTTEEPAAEAPADEAAEPPPVAEEAPVEEPPPAEEASPAPPAEEVPPTPPVDQASQSSPPEEAPAPPVEPAPPSAELPPSTDEALPTPPVETVPISAPVTPTPAPRIEVAPTAENLRIDLAVERTSNLAGKTVRFHTRETNVGADPIRLPALNDFDVVVEQNGMVVWKLSDVRRARAALLPSQGFEPMASRGVSVWWDGFRSRGGRLPVSGEVVVYSTMDGIDSARQTIQIDPTPARTPRPAPQPVRVEILPPTPPPPAPVTPPATATNAASPATTPATPPPATTTPADPVPAGSATTGAGSSSTSSPAATGTTSPAAGSPTTPAPPPATTTSGAPTTTSTTSGGSNTTTTPPITEDPTDAATTGQPEITTQVGGRRRWNTAIYGAVGQAWKQKRFQVPRPTIKPMMGVQQGIRQARLARAEALANRLR